MEESHLVERTIFISDLGYSATDFNLCRDDMDKLVESGHAGAKKYLEWVNSKSKMNQNTN
jgi:NTE family protein